MDREVTRFRVDYSELFGWKIDAAPGPMEFQYGVIAREANVSASGVGIGGGIGAARAGYPGHLTVYVEVPDVEAALSAAESLGGSRIIGPEQVPGGPVMGRFKDPEDNIVSLQQRAGPQ